MTHPVQVDENANFLTRDLSNGNSRKRRDIESAYKEPVYFHLSAFGQNVHLNVTLNDELLSPNFVVEIRGNQSSRFHFDIEHCHYTGQVVSAKGLGTRVALSNCDGLVSNGISFKREGKSARKRSIFYHACENYDTTSTSCHCSSTPCSPQGVRGLENESYLSCVRF